MKPQDLNADLTLVDTPLTSHSSKATPRHAARWRTLVALACTGLLVACGGGSDGVGGSAAFGAGAGAGAGGGPGSHQATVSMGTALASVPASPLSADEEAGLIFMREEEKLARDVYAALHARWGLNTFDNIAASEQSHMDALLMLLQRYALPDPAATTAAGAFANPVLQGLYGALEAAGQTSLVAALQVGAQIEELDIRDLRAVKATVDNADLTLVYENLKWAPATTCRLPHQPAAARRQLHARAHHAGGVRRHRQQPARDGMP
jgi:hypothetical protein